MKTLRHTCAAIILTLALAVSILAGEVDCPGVITPPPPTTTSGITTTVILAIVSLIK